jgi:RND family efflux transporter MFP subunit
MIQSIKYSSVILALALIFSCKPNGKGDAFSMPPSPVTLKAVEEKELIVSETFTGRLEASEWVELRAKAGGQIVAVTFQAGQQVKKGDLLFQIDDRQAKTKLQQAEADLTKTKTIHQQQEKEHQRTPALLKAKAISNEQAEQRESIYTQAAADLQAAEARYHSSKIALEHTEVRAPIDGQAGRALLTTGNHVIEGVQVLTTIAKTQPIHLYLDMDERRFLEMQRSYGKLDNIEVSFTLGNLSDQVYKGTLESIDNRIQPGTGTMLLRINVENPKNELFAGTYVRVEVPVKKKQKYLLIDESSVLTDQASKYVLCVDENKTCTYRPVVLGQSVDGKRILKQGLVNGEMYIINGQARLPMPGMPVEVVGQ